MARYECLPSGGRRDNLTLIDLRRHAQQYGAYLEQSAHDERRKRAAQLRRIRAKLRSRHQSFLKEMSAIAQEQVRLALGVLEQELLGELEHESLYLALGIVQRFLGEVLPKDERYLARALRVALQKFQEERTMVLLSHPRNEPLAQKLIQELGDGESHITVELDESLEPGIATLRTAFGSIRIDWKDEYEQLVRNIVIELTKCRGREET